MSAPALFVLPSMSARNRVKKIFRAGETRGKCLLGQRPHKVVETGNDKMRLHSNRPGAAATARGATQEVATPMPEQRTRFTVYAVSRDCRTFNGDSGVPHGHRATLEEAQAHARQLDADRECHPTRIVERIEAHPFEIVQIVWRCDS